MNSRVKRTYLAGLIAPFAVYPTVFVMLLPDVLFGDGSIEESLGATLVFGSVAAFYAILISLLVGVFWYWRLEEKGRNTWLVCALTGWVFGLVGAAPYWIAMRDNLIVFVLASGCGIAVGLTFRAIAGNRDRNEEQDAGTA